MSFYCFYTCDMMIIKIYVMQKQKRESQTTSYYLNMRGKNINLNNTYLDAISEAQKIVRKHLKILRPDIKLEILTQGAVFAFMVIGLVGLMIISTKLFIQTMMASCSKSFLTAMNI